MNSKQQSWLGLVRRQIALLAVILVAVLLVLPAPANAISASNFIILTNKERTSRGLAPLSYNSRLASSAYAKANDMLTHGYWAHTSPNGTTAWTFIKNAGYSYVTVGENLARDFSSDAATVAGWMASPGHRENILNTAYRDVGIAAVQGTMNGQSVSLVVAHYGATSTAAAPKPAPKPKVKTTQPKATTQKVNHAPKPKAKPVKTTMVSQPKRQTEKPISAFQKLIQQLVQWLEVSPSISVIEQ